MSNRQFKLHATIFSTFLFVILFIGSGCAVNGNETQYVPDIQIMSVKYHWPQALELAKKWHPDAYIREASIHVQLPKDLSSSQDVISFAALTPNYEKKVLKITCRRECQSEELTTTVVLPQCQPIHLNDIVITGEEALRIGLASGGSSLVHDKHTTLIVGLERFPARCTGENVVWEVYVSNHIANETIRVAVDARSGEVLEIDQ